MSEEPKQTGKGVAPELTAIAGIASLGVGFAFEYSWSMAAIAVGAILFVLGVWSAIR